MAAGSRSGHGRTRTRALAAAVVVTALVTGACSGGGGGSSSSARKRAASTTSTSVLVESTVIGGGTVVSDNETQTFVIDKNLTVVVPVGAVTKGSEIEVREVTGAATDLGAVQVGGKVYALAVKNGKIQSSKQVSLVYKLGEPLPASDPRPVGGWLDEADKVWRPVSVDRSAGGDEVTVFAPKAGKYTWLRWSWDKAVQAGADAVRQVVGPRTVGDATLTCKDTDEVRGRFDLQTNVGNALAWCAGREGGTDVIRVRNAGQAPLALRYKGFSTPSSTNRSVLFTKVSDAARVVWAPAADESVTIAEPGDELTFAITDASVKGLLRAEVNGFSQHFDAIAAAAAFVVGYHAGNAEIATELLESNAAVRDLLLGQLATPGCVNGLGDAVTQATYATDRLAEFTAQLTLKCVDGDVVTAIRKAAASTELGSLRASFTAPEPATVKDRFGPALRAALGPVVEATGGPVAGEIIMTPKNSTGGETPTLAPVGTAPPAAPTVAPPTTVGAVAGPATTLVIGTTTQATAPPVGTTTTVPATTTTTRAPATTLPATTTTTRAPTTTAAPTTTTAPPGPTTFEVIQSPCGLTGGTLRSTSSGFRAGFKWTATLFSPDNRSPAFTSLGDVAPDGSTGWTFNCSSVTEAGVYRVSISEVCPAGSVGCTPRPEITKQFVVNVYDTVWVPLAERFDLGLCSGAPPLANPAGSFEQTFVAGGPTITQVGIVNRELFSARLRLLKGVTELWSGPFTANGSPDVRIAIGPLAAPIAAGDVLRLVVDNVVPTASAPNNALNFWYTGSAVAASGAVTTNNLCAWKDPTHLVDPPAGADILGWIAP